jgi:hypothetical protein
LLGHDAQVAAESESDLLRGPKLLRNRVESRVEGIGAVAHRLVEQIVFRVDMGVERALLDTHRLGQITDRCAVVALFCKQPGRLTR